MKRFIEGEARSQATLLPEYLDDYIAEDNPVRAVDAFVDELELKTLGFEGADPAVTGLDRKPQAMTLRRRTIEACVWDAEALDGLNALPHARTGTCRHRDELARPCLQPQATDQFAWHSEDDQSNEVTRRLTGGLTACRSRSRRSIIERETSLPSSTPATTAFPHSLGQEQPHLGGAQFPL